MVDVVLVSVSHSAAWFCLVLPNVIRTSAKRHIMSSLRWIIFGKLFTCEKKYKHFYVFRCISKCFHPHGNTRTIETDLFHRPLLHGGFFVLFRYIYENMDGKSNSNEHLCRES